jgi:heptosyltransferase I
MKMPMDISLDRVCIVMLGAVGDVVHTLPVLSAIKRHHPAAKVSWILQPGPASLVRGHPDPDEIILFHRSRGLKAFAELRRELRERSFTLTLAMQSYFKAGVIAAMTPSPVRLGFDRARARDMTWIFNNRSLPSRPERHFQDQYLEFLDAIGVPAEPLTWNLGPWAEEITWRNQFAAQFHRPIASLVVGASRAEREWVEERWIPVARELYSTFGLMPVVVGGKSEKEASVFERIRQESGVPVHSTLGVPFRQLVSVLDASALVISVNTGPMHIAVALNRPTISLHGFANPKRVGPYRRFHDLMIDAYGDPGEDYPITRINRPGRMQHITVHQVLEKVERWVAVYGVVSR